MLPLLALNMRESLFQNMAADIAEVQTLGGIILLGGDFNARTATLLDTIH
jgi:hypothetical protein